MKPSTLQLSAVQFSYGTHTVFTDLNLTVEPGDILMLMGRNGSGKSTLLKLIAGLIHPVQGAISYGDVSFNSLTPNAISRLGVGYLMQGGGTFPSLTVEENLAFAQSRGSSGKLRALSPALKSVYSVVLPHLKKRAGLLSGGERQALAISMIVAQNPSVLLLDEPVAALSSELSAATAKLISVLCGESHCLAVIAEHNLSFAASLKARRFELEPVVSVQLGPP
ncbi:MAG TPA: ATP-binding cassette domain-containing protein [Pyrinomonadaceae bacterium]|nr:ATP-binding cassette domain-containing protein [Pyrinomonadaceae bacterium]